MSTKNILACFLVLLSCLLLAMAARVLPARLLGIAGDLRSDAVLADKNLSDEDYTAFVKAREAAVRWYPFADYLNELATAYSARAGHESDRDQSDTLLTQSRNSQIRALGLEPADSYGWSQMAYLEMQDDSQKTHAVDDLRMSIESAPYEPTLMPSRLEMVVLLQDSLGADEREQIPVVAREAFEVDPHAVAASAQSYNYISVVESALARDEKALQQFHALLAQNSGNP